MPIGMDKAPQSLPQAAKDLWVKTFNGVFENCEGTEARCDEAAAKLAWTAVKRKYKKVKNEWIAKSEYEDSYHDVLLTITKASLQPDGSVRWQAVASDTGKDKAEERTSLDLFQDWIDRVTYKADVGYLPEPKMPFLGVSHYPALDGFGEAGVTRRMYIDGNTFKADGVFNPDSGIGQKLLNAVKTELALVKKGNQPEKPIRISAGWWDIQHYHEDSNFLFTRQSLIDKCPICERGQTSDKVYKAGQLDHFAATRVPMNPRTSLELEEKSMAKITRREDAESIIGPDEAEEMERRARMVGKSETGEAGELHPAMATKGDMKQGEYMRDMRRKKKLELAEVAKRMKAKEDRIKRFEDDEEEMDEEMMANFAAALKMSDEEKEEMLARFGKKRRKEPPMKKKAAMKTVEGEQYPAGDFLVVEDPEKPTTWHLQVKRKGEADRGLMGNAWAALHKGFRGNKYEGPDKAGAIQRLTKMYEDEEAPLPTEKMDYGEGEMAMPMMPLGGATSLKEADDYIQAQERMDQMYSYWDMLQIAFSNIKRDEEITDKMKAVSSLFREMASKIDTLKAGLSDAFLIQESAAAYEDYEDAGEEIEYSESNEVNTMSEEIITPTSQTGDPEEVLQAARKAALENKALTREERETAIQEAFNVYAQAVQGQLQEADPIPQADQIATAIKGALADVLTPLAEQVGLLTAKMGDIETQKPQGVTKMHEVYVPQQKSMMAPPTTPQPVQPTPGMPISPVTGKPSSLTAKIRKSVGLHS